MAMVTGSFNRVGTNTLSLFYVMCLFGLASAAPKTPAAGWCKNCGPPKAAQSGYRGYCKPCFRQQFPEEHTQKTK